MQFWKKKSDVSVLQVREHETFSRPLKKTPNKIASHVEQGGQDDNQWHRNNKSSIIIIIIVPAKQFNSIQSNHIMSCTAMVLISTATVIIKVTWRNATVQQLQIMSQRVAHSTNNTWLWYCLVASIHICRIFTFIASLRCWLTFL